MKRRYKEELQNSLGVTINEFNTNRELSEYETISIKQLLIKSLMYIAQYKKVDVYENFTKENYNNIINPFTLQHEISLAVMNLNTDRQQYFNPNLKKTLLSSLIYISEI